MPSSPTSSQAYMFPAHTFTRRSARCSATSADVRPATVKKAVAPGAAVRRHVIELLQPAVQMVEQLQLVRLDGGHRGDKPLPPGGRSPGGEGCQVLDGGGDAGEVGEGRRAGLETLGHIARRWRELVRVQALEHLRVRHDRADVRA
jgi:hypothetical protein